MGFWWNSLLMFSIMVTIVFRQKFFGADHLLIVGRIGLELPGRKCSVAGVIAEPRIIRRASALLSSHAGEALSQSKLRGERSSIDRHSQVNMKLALVTLQWKFISLTVLIASQLFYFACLLFMCEEWFALNFQWETWKIGYSIFGSTTGWTMFICVTLFALIPDVLVEAYKATVGLDPLRLQMYHERAGGANACFCGVLPPAGIECQSRWLVYEVFAQKLMLSGSVAPEWSVPLVFALQCGTPFWRPCSFRLAKFWHSKTHPDADKDMIRIAPSKPGTNPLPEPIPRRRKAAAKYLP